MSDWSVYLSTAGPWCIFATDCTAQHSIPQLEDVNCCYTNSASLAASICPMCFVSAQLMHLTPRSTAPIPECFIAPATKPREQRVTPVCLHAAISQQEAGSHTASSKFLPVTYTGICWLVCCTVLCLQSFPCCCACDHENCMQYKSMQKGDLAPMHAADLHSAALLCVLRCNVLCCVVLRWCKDCFNDS